MPVTHGGDPTEQPSACPTDGEGLADPPSCLWETYSPEAQKTGDGRESSRESRLWPCFRDPSSCSASLKSRARSSALSLGLHSWGSLSGLSPVALAGATSAAAVAAGDAGEVKAPGVDGHSLRAEDAANGSGGGGAHGGVLREGAEDGAGQGHHHGGGLDDDDRVLALPATGLVAAAGQRGRAAGLAGLARVAAGHGLGLEVHLGERAGRKHGTGTPQEQPATPPKGSQGRGLHSGKQGLLCPSSAGSCA